MNKNEQTGELTFSTIDFVELAKQQHNTDVHNLFLKNVIMDEYYFRDELNYQTTIRAQQEKLDYHKELLGGNKIITANEDIGEARYYRMMFEIIVKEIVADSSFYGFFRVNNLSFRDKGMLLDYLNTIFTDEVLVSNTLPENIILNVTDMFRALHTEYNIRNHPNKEALEKNPIKKYQKGMKITRFLMSFSEVMNSKSPDMEKRIGRFRIDPNDKVGVYISAYLPSFIKAGAVGNSCLSKGGVNEHSTFLTLGYPNVLIVHDKDFSYRAWLAVDYKKKYYTLARTYPRENYFLQLMVHEHMKKQGFTFVIHYFQFPEYMDMGGASNFDKKQVEDENNRDAYFTWTSGLFFEKYWNSDSKRIAALYQCYGCDRQSVREDFLNSAGYCESCENSDEDDEEHFYCEDCGEREHNDYSNYDEDTGSYYCNGCYESLIERRQEAEEEKEPPKLEDISISLDYNLLRRAPDKEYDNLMPLIKNMGDRIIQNRDIALFKNLSSKITNGREKALFLNLMTAAGIKWRAGQQPLEYDPIRGGGRYSFFIELDEGTNRLAHNQETGDGKTISELYIRYFYLARNKLYAEKHGENASELFKYAYPEANIDESIFTKNFTLASIGHIYSLLEIDRPFRFHDLETLQKMMIVLNSIGYRKSDLTNILTSTFDINNNYQLSKKGLLSLETLTTDSIIITPAMMDDILNQ